MWNINQGAWLLEITGRNGLYIIRFKNEMIKEFLEGKEEFNVNTESGHFELSAKDYSLMFSYAGYGNKIKWY